MTSKKTLITHAGMPKPLAAEIRETDDGIMLVLALSEDLLNEQTGALKIQLYPHNEIHEGNNFYIKNWQDVDGLGTNLDFLWVVPDTTKWPNAVWDIAGEAEFTLSLYRGVTTSDDGTPVTVFNNDHNSSKTPGVTAFSAPTITDMGTLVWAGKIGSGRNATESRGTFGEIIGLQNAKYLFRITKEAAGTHWVDYMFSWYEHRNK